MKKRIAVGVAGTIAVLGLAYIPGGAPEPGFAPRVVNVQQAEHEAQEKLKELTPYCESLGRAAEAWAEINSEENSGYEIIGNCV